MRRPDIVLILADDLGYSDLGCYGGELRTPNLDRLGRAGVRLAQFYNTARCSPSRASLLTGKHPHQAGIGVLTRPDLPEGYRGDLAPDVQTIAELLGAQGWRTWMSGKWHLSSDLHQVSDSWPTRRGFERFYGTLAGCSSYFEPQTLTDGEVAADPPDDDFYYTDAISDHATAWIDEHASSGSDDPFFLYLAYSAPHWPLHARPSDLAATRGRFDEGWDRLREARLQRLIGEQLVDAGTELSARDPSQPAWERASDREWQAKRMETFAAQVEAMDRGIGRVLDALERAGRLENAIVIFLSDNGGSAEELPIGPLATFALKDDAMQRTGPDRVRIGNSPDIVPGPPDTYASYGVPWANLSNSPFRRYKRWVHEGGIATPFIFHWPAGGVARGSVAHTAFQLVNVVPTLLEAAGVQADRFEAEGTSMLQALRGQSVADQTLYWEHIGNAAIRRGRWKLVREQAADWELYDIVADRTELHDLAAAHPDVVSDLAADWHRWAERVGVIPWDRMLASYAREGRPPLLAEE